MTNVLTQGVPLLMWFHAEVVVKMPVVGVLLTVITVILRASLAQFLLQKKCYMCFSFWGIRHQAPYRGFAPGYHWGLPSPSPLYWTLPASNAKPTYASA